MEKEAKPQGESKSKIEQRYEGIKKKPFYFVITLLAAFIIGLGTFTGALASIPENITKIAGYFHSPTTPTPAPIKQGTIIYRHITPQWGGILTWSPNGDRIANTNSDGTIQVWDATTGQNPVIYQGFRKKTLLALVWSHDSTHLASASSDGSIQIWLADSGVETFNYSVTDLLNLAGKQGPNSQVNAIAWSADDQQIAFGDSNGDVAVVSLGEEPLRPYDISVLKKYQDSISGLAWSPNGQQLAVAGGLGFDIWNVQSFPPQLIKSYGVSYLESLAWSPNGKFIAAMLLLAYSSAPGIWNTTTKNLVLQQIPEHELSLAWACDSNRIALGGSDAVTIWDIAANKAIFKFKDVVNASSVAWSPDGTLIASGSGNYDKGDGSILIWQAANKKLC